MSYHYIKQWKKRIRVNKVCCKKTRDQTYILVNLDTKKTVISLKVWKIYEEENIVYLLKRQRY